MAGLGLSFLHPAALWALATLAIPVLIHLFNRSRGRLVKIGHIDLIRNARKLKVTELKLADWVLLLLRLCLFALAAMLLAGLAQPGLSSSKKDTAYVSAAWLNNARPETVADLLQQYADTKSSRVILLQNDFPLLDTQLAEDIRLDNAASLDVRNIWPLLAERLSLEHHQGSVEVFAVDDLEQFGSYRPDLPVTVIWQLAPVEADDSPSPMVVNAVVAYEQTRSQDAELVNAALKALQASRLPGLNWRVVEIGALTAGLQSVDQPIDWLIMLSADAIDFSALIDIASPGVVLSDADGEATNISTEQLRLPFYPFSEFQVSKTGTPVAEYSSLVSLLNTRLLLQQSWHGPTRLVHFNSRFNTAWSTIAVQPEFPELLLQLMLNDEQRKHAFAGADVLLSQLSSVPISSPTPLPRRSLQQLLAALMVLMWVGERALSEWKRREQR